MAQTEHLVVEGGVVIFNPTAGRGTAEKAVAAAKERLGPGFEFRPTQRPGHAIELAREAAKTHQIVVALGGDGTVGDVTRGIYGTEAALGILPLGTGNDVARNLGLKLDLNEACSTILGGVIRRIDIGLINGTPFINNCGTGFDAAVMRTMNTSIRFTKGQSAFILAVLKTAPSFKPFTLTLDADGEKLTYKAMMISVLNGTQYAAGMKAAPTAEMDDGMMDVLIVKAMPKLGLLFGLFPKLTQGQHVGHKAVEMLRIRSLKITTVPPQPLNIDGDISGLTPASVTVNPRSLKVLVR